MKDELSAAGAVVGSVAIASLFAGLAMAIYPGWPAVGVWLSDQAAPAWVQAVGSVAAILVAVGLPYMERARLRKTNASLLVASSKYLLSILTAAHRKTPEHGIRAAIETSQLHLRTLKTLGAEVRPGILPSEALPVYVGLQSLASEVDDFFQNVGKTVSTEEQFLVYVQRLIDDTHGLLVLARERTA